MKFSNQLLVASLIPAMMASAEDSCKSIAEIACGDDQFSTLCTAVKAAGLDSALATEKFTVFAPTDEAFSKLPDGTVEALLEEVPTLKTILLFHTVADEMIYSKDLKCTELLTMTNGNDSRTVCRRGGRRKFQKGAGNKRSAMPAIIRADMEACNGVIHVVNNVMLPPPNMKMAGDMDDGGHMMDGEEEEEECMSIAEIACTDDRFTTLCTAVQATGLDGPLATEKFTVFAPTDDAFDMLPDGTVEALLDDIPTLTDILLFHTVADRKIYSKRLQCTKLTEMSNGSDSRTVCRRKGRRKYQKGAGNERDAMPEIISKNVEACNGLIHVVNEVMLP